MQEIRRNFLPAREKLIVFTICRALVIALLIIFILTIVFTGQEVSAQQPDTSIHSNAMLPRDAAFELVHTTLIQIIDTSNDAWDPSSPDPAGIAYWPSRGTLLVADSEVDEMSDYFTGVNVFESSLAGDLLTTCSTTSIYRRGWSNEPTGVAINPNNNHIFFSDDSGEGKLHEVKPGPDGIYCTRDDTVTTVRAPGMGDAEGIAYGENTLFIAGGRDQKVYIVDLGPNGVLGGGDDGEFTSFDTGFLGFHDVEGVEYNPDNQTLFIVSTAGSDQYIGEVSLTGELIRLYNLDYLGKISRSGLAYGPSSWNPDTKSIYLVSSGVDNRRDPDENDGKIWEIHLGILMNDEAPTVLAITRVDPNPTSKPSVEFNVAFSEPVAGVSEADFILSLAGEITSASIASVSGSSSTYTVIVDTGIENGEIRLDVVDRDTIVDRDGNPLGGSGIGNGSYMAGESYIVQKGSIQVEPVHLDFEDNIIRGWASTKTVTIRNAGVGSVQLGRLSISDNALAGSTMFLVENNCDNAILEAGATCSFEAGFRPIGQGPVKGQVTIPSEILEQPYQVNLIGNGIHWMPFVSNLPVRIGANEYKLLDVWLYIHIPKGFSVWLGRSSTSAFAR
jgi:hypothetical protein